MKRRLYAYNREFLDNTTLVWQEGCEVWETEPCKRTVEWAGCQYYIQFPTMIWNFVNHSLRVGFLKKPLTSFEDKIYWPPFPNVYEYGRVCGATGNTIKEAIDAFWTTSFVGEGLMHRTFRRWFDCLPLRVPHAKIDMGLKWRRWSAISKKRNAVRKLMDRVTQFMSLGLFFEGRIRESQLDFNAPYCETLEPVCILEPTRPVNPQIELNTQNLNLYNTTHDIERSLAYLRNTLQQWDRFLRDPYAGH